VQEAAVNLATESARVRFAGDAAGMAPLLRRAVRDAGYEPRAADAALQEENASPWAGFAPVVTGLVLCLPLLAPMLLMPLGIHWMLPAWAQCLLAVLVQFGLGARFYRAGWHTLKSGSGNMDLLVAVGTSAAWGLSLWLWLTLGHGAPPHLYFESAAVVITLVRLGKWLEVRAKRQTSAASFCKSTCNRSVYRAFARAMVIPSLPSLCHSGTIGLSRFLPEALPVHPGAAGVTCLDPSASRAH
jgi:Cu+-exporting ATPase